MDNNNLLALMAALMRNQSPADVYDRDYAIQRHMDARSNFASQTAGKYATSFTSTTCEAPNASLPPVDIVPANIITMDEIIRKGPDTVHAGKFLLCRSIGPSWKINAINLVLDDPAGEKALPLSLYNYRPKITGKRLTDADLVPVGSKVALLNPWLKRSMSGFPALRCENPTQFVILDESHPILKDRVWKVPLPSASVLGESGAYSSPSYDSMEPGKAGLCYFADKKYDKAVEAYTKAIESDSGNALLFANRAAAYLAMNKPAMALEDAEKGLKIDSSNLKLLFRKGKALFALKRYEECLDFLKRDVKRGGVPEVSSLFNDVQLAVRESKTGKYDLMQIVEEAEKSPYLEHAEFFDASLVEVKPVAGCERGLIAKVDIPAGTLICASKAFAFRKTDLKSTQINLDLSNRCVDIGNQEQLAAISEKLLDDPSLGREFYKLYAGEKLRWLEPEDYDQSHPVDIERIQQVIRCNSFACGSDLGLGDMSKYFHDSGIWLWPSYINHSCTEINCVHPIFGDFMFVRAIKNIAKGDQLFIQYCPPTDSFEKRDEVLRGSYGFVCNCKLCLMESAETPETREAVKKISETLESLKKTKKSKSKSKKGKGKAKSASSADEGDLIGTITSLLEEARSLRQDQSLNLLACEIADHLAFLHLKQRHFKQTIDLLLSCFKIYEDFGLSVKALDTAHGLFLCYAQLSNQREASAWDVKTRSLAKIMFGDEKMLGYLQNHATKTVI